MNVYDKAHELAKAIKYSSEYKRFEEAKESVDKDEKAKNMLNNFLKKQFELEIESQGGKEPDKEKMEQLQKLYQVIVYNNDIVNFLESQRRFGQMISDIYKILGDAVKIDLDFLKEIQDNTVTNK